MKKILAAVTLVALVFFSWQHHRPVNYPAGVLLAAEPTQTEIENGAAFSFGKFALKPLAHFEAKVRVLHLERYRYDRQAGLVPLDLAVGWGPMSDQAVLDQRRISQSMRFFWYEYQMPPPIAPDAIISHATNIHIIPATRDILSKCAGYRRGELVRLEGRLVEASGPGISRWRSSLSRTDSGNGACELLFLEKAEVIQRDADGSLIAKSR